MTLFKLVFPAPGGPCITMLDWERFPPPSDIALIRASC